jgi:hypothetical protein
MRKTGDVWNRTVALAAVVSFRAMKKLNDVAA